jgi:hypothetical protein
MSFSRVIFQLVVHVVLCAAKDLFEGELPLTHTYVDGTRVWSSSAILPFLSTRPTNLSFLLSHARCPQVRWWRPVSTKRMVLNPCSKPTWKPGQNWMALKESLDLKVTTWLFLPEENKADTTTLSLHPLGKNLKGFDLKATWLVREDTKQGEQQRGAGREASCYGWAMAKAK